MSTGDPWVFKKQEQEQLSPSMIVSATPSNNIVLHSAGTEMLRVADDGFYVRGVRVEQDETEAKQVYDAFKSWLTWATLNQ